MVKKQNEIYRCSVCGNVAEVMHVGGGELVCCGKPMELQNENVVEAAHEKHIPVIEKTENGIKVKVGAVEHPMEEAHHIQWIEVIVDGKDYHQFLSPGDKPEAEFLVSGENISVRAYCNLHGLWMA